MSVSLLKINTIFHDATLDFHFFTSQNESICMDYKRITILLFPLTSHIGYLRNNEVRFFPWKSTTPTLFTSSFSSELASFCDTGTAHAFFDGSWESHLLGNGHQQGFRSIVRNVNEIRIPLSRIVNCCRRLFLFPIVVLFGVEESFDDE